MDMAEKIGRKIAALRKEQDWTQQELGMKAGLSEIKTRAQNRVSRLENGSGHTIEALDAVAVALGLESAEELISLAREIPDLDAAAS